MLIKTHHGGFFVFLRTILLYLAYCVRTNQSLRKFCSAFSKADAVKGAQPLYSLFSFCGAFSLGFSSKEKADMRKAVVKVSATDYRYQDSLAAFLCHKRHLFSCLPYGSHLLTQNRKRKAMEKKCRVACDGNPQNSTSLIFGNPCAASATLRGAPLLKKRSKTFLSTGWCEHSATKQPRGFAQSGRKYLKPYIDKKSWF